MTELICKRCNQPVRINKESYDLFEQMHWICFHFEYEHSVGNYDPDEPCKDVSCPWNNIKIMQAVIKRNNLNLELEGEFSDFWKE